MLLYPEGMVKLSGSAGEILKRVHGGCERDNRSSKIWNRHSRAPTCEATSSDFWSVAYGKGWIRVKQD